MLAWREQLEAVSRGEVPIPVTVFVDPSNICQVNCYWCSCKDFRQSRPVSLPNEVLMALPKFLKDWGVKAVEVGGGGEPLMHPKVGEFMVELHRLGLEVGLQTNGVKLADDILAAQVLEACEWVGFSLDAATSKTYLRLKRALIDHHQRVIENISKLAKSRQNGRPKLTAKFLVHHHNYGEVYQFADILKCAGADEVHIRPLYSPTYKYNEGVRKTAEWHLRESRKDLETANFKVYGIIHKFDPDWVRIIRFQKCRATPLVGVFAADGMFYMCPDRRGEQAVSLGKFFPFENLKKVWGSPAHLDKIERISPQSCPKCSLCMANEVIENVILKPGMTLKFL